ncbi:SDR family oxidoreductase [Arthrobacter sp.]|uniref:SDR family oxidoreductase n=1 Tax=Arthrobacter sp. TaxID=1667 RepID=UPI0026DEDA06|nr:SDR family oxidoreductase [Arthrobacter sp.]MDO5752867.1 SDR family oxidoreductase [Arthrobacter sp.]
MTPGTVVLVTGAAGGIGRACALRIRAESGPDCMLVLADHDAAGLDGVAGELGGPNLVTVPTDVSDPDSVDGLFETISRLDGHLAAVVHAAGVLSTGSALATGLAEWRHVMSVNADGTFLVATAAARQLLESPARNRSIVYIGSNAAGVPRATMPVYSASKAAAAALMRAIGLELAPQGIRCNTVCPGSTDTDMQRRMWGSDREGGLHSVLTGDPAQFRVGIPLGRLADPGDIADAALFLLSERARHITMQDLYVDGGATLRA